MGTTEEHGDLRSNGVGRDPVQRPGLCLDVSRCDVRQLTDQSSGHAQSTGQSGYQDFGKVKLICRPLNKSLSYLRIGVVVLDIVAAMHVAMASPTRFMVRAPDAWC